MRTRNAVRLVTLCLSLSGVWALDNGSLVRATGLAPDGLSGSDMRVLSAGSTPAHAAAGLEPLACTSPDRVLRSDNSQPVTINCELFPVCPDTRSCDVECGLLELDSCYETSVGASACCFVEVGSFSCPNGKTVTAVTCDCENCSEGSLQLTCR